MKDLIERLENAEGPDRELDADIDLFHRGQSIPLPPLYTSLIDAALTLVPEGRWWVLNSGVQSGSSRAQVDSGHPWETIDGFGATPAIAMCIAALKARDLAERDMEAAR